MDPLGFVYLLGYHKGDCDIDPEDSELIITASGSWSGFLSKIDTSGTLNWGAQLDGSSLDQTNEVKIDGGGNVFVAGHFQGNIDCDPSSGSFLLTTSGSNDGVLLKLEQCIPNHVSFSQSGCQPLLSPDGEELWESSGTYYDTLTNVFGCDSIIQVEVEIFEVNTDVIQTSLQLMAVESDGNYSWMSCSDGEYSEIPGENGQTFTATEAGAYAVSIEKNGCQDTSDCYTILDFSEMQEENKNYVELYPNPASSFFIINSSTPFQSLSVIDPRGRCVRKLNKPGSQFEVQTKDLEKGLYLLICELDNGSSFTRKLSVE